MARKDNHVNSPIEQGLCNAIKEAQEHPKFGLVTLCFHEYTQAQVEEIYEEIEEVLEDYFGSIITVDV